jgi:hypothetical protein
MRALTEKITRKAAESMHRLFSAPATPVDHVESVTITISHLQRLSANLPNTFTPYDFVSPDSLRQDILFSEEGIPLRHISDRRAYQNPVFVAYWGLAQHQRYIRTHDAGALSIAIRMYEILSAVADGKGRLFYTIDLSRFGLHAPWISGLAQSLSASLSVRLYLTTQDTRYSGDALKYLRPVLMPVTEGGCLQVTPEGLPWIEEYPGNPPSHVLNGFLFSLIALIEAAALYPQQDTTTLNALLNSLVRCYPGYVAGRYLRYDRLHGTFCNPHYMGLQVLLLCHLHGLTAHSWFAQRARDLSRHTDWMLYAQSVHYPGDIHAAISSLLR